MCAWVYALMRWGRGGHIDAFRERELGFFEQGVEGVKGHNQARQGAGMKKPQLVSGTTPLLMGVPAERMDCKLLAI